jgi:hypothetical protein
MATKLEKMARTMNDDFREKLAEAVKEKFGIEVKTEFNIFDMRLITSRVDGEQFTAEQHEWIGAFSEGYTVALSMVRDAA